MGLTGNFCLFQANMNNTLIEMLYMPKQTDRVRHATVVACDGVLGTSLGITTDLYALLEAQLSMSGK